MRLDMPNYLNNHRRKCPCVWFFMELFNSLCLDMRGIIYVLEDDQGIREVIELILG